MRYFEFTREKTFLPTGVNFVWDTFNRLRESAVGTVTKLRDE
jgi:hypothetical protein